MKRIFAHIGFSVATVLIVLNLIGIKYVLAITIGLAVIFAASLVLPKYKKAMVVPVCAGSAVLACLIFMGSYYGTAAPQLALSNQNVTASFYITDICEIDDEQYIYTAKTVKIEKEDAPQNIKLRIKSSSPIDAEDYRVVKAKLRLYKVGENAFSSFGYWGNGIFLSGVLNSYTPTNESINSPWKYVLKLRKDIIVTLSSSVGGDSGYLSAALVTGNKSGLSDESRNNFKYAGASHLMAVSGFHLTVMIGMLVLLLKRLGVNDRVISALSLFGILFVVGLAGFSKSVIRAGIMMSVMLFAKLIGRRGDGINSLGFAVFLICLNPFAVSDVGAQLSVLSVLSLLTLQPELLKLIDKGAVSETDGFVLSVRTQKLGLFVANGFSVSFSVMVYTLPAMYISFGYVSIVALVSNILLVPLGNICIVLSLFTYIFSKIHFMAFVFAKVCGFFSSILLYLVHHFAMLKNSVISISGSFGIILAGILAVFAFCFILNNKRFMKIVGAGSLAVVVVFFTVFSFANTTSNVLVCENGAVAISDKGRCTVYGVDDKSDYYSVRQFLFASHSEIDKMIVPVCNDYSLKLINEFSCQTLVTSTISEEILKNANCREVQYCLEYSARGIAYTNSYCLFDVNNVTIAVENGSSSFGGDIIITKNSAEDIYGKIDLSKGDVVYTVKNDGLYSARRVDAWQK